MPVVMHCCLHQLGFWTKENPGVSRGQVCAKIGAGLDGSEGVALVPPFQMWAADAGSSSLDNFVGPDRSGGTSFILVVGGPAYQPYAGPLPSS